MKNYKRSAKIALIASYVFVVLLIAFTVSLPWLTRWYVEDRGRSADLFATIMLATYPCVPLAAITLISLIKLFEHVISNSKRMLFLGESTTLDILNIALECGCHCFAQ